MLRKLTRTDELVEQCRLLRLPTPIREYRFLQERRWRFDLAWPDIFLHPLPCLRLGLEIDGGHYLARTGKESYHFSNTAGVTNHLDKNNTALATGWLVLHVLPAWIPSGKAVDLIERTFLAYGAIKPNPAHRSHEWPPRSPNRNDSPASTTRRSPPSKRPPRSTPRSATNGPSSPSRR